ncbi:MAG: GAF domain-containing protein [Gammaproteobacteria bacterium]|nr:GAF domain-containing protein [Gammaproteobacteria bacterium]
MKTEHAIETTSDYGLLIKQAESLLSGESDPIANAANLASMLYYAVADVNWVGFYFLRDGELVLGPFSGQPACTRIALGRGVCGTAFAERSTQRVADVHEFEGHIACDAASRSEVVVPFYTDLLSGVLDIDSPSVNRFGEAEQVLFERAAQVYQNSLQP